MGQSQTEISTHRHEPTPRAATTPENPRKHRSKTRSLQVTLETAINRNRPPKKPAIRRTFDSLTPYNKPSIYHPGKSQSTDLKETKTMRLQRLKISEEDLSSQLREVADRIGIEAVFSLCYHFAGQRIYVPKKMDSCHRIVALIGKEKAQELINHSGGCYLHFPMKAWRRVRDREILENRSALSAVEIAQRYDISPTYAWEKIRQLKRENPGTAIEVTVRHYRPSLAVESKMRHLLESYFGEEGADTTILVNNLTAIIAEIERRDAQENVIELAHHQKPLSSPLDRKMRQFLGTWFGKGFSTPKSLVLALKDVIAEAEQGSAQSQ